MVGLPADLAAALLRTLALAIAMLVALIVTMLLIARSRRREYEADRRAAAVTGDPLALARALWKIERAVQHDLRIRGLIDPHAPAPSSNLLLRLLATHPDPPRRIDRLLRLAVNRPLSRHPRPLRERR